MDAASFIARRLRFKGSMAKVSIAVSFLVMIMAVSISAGFRKEIRRGVSSYSGDIQITNSSMNYLGEEDPMPSSPDFFDAVASVKGVRSLVPAVYRAGIIKSGEDIQGVLFKGVPTSDSVSLQVSVPDRLARVLNLSEGDELLTYFVGEKVKARKFTVKSIYRNLVDTDETLLIYSNIRDLQRLNGWDEDEVSALEVTLDEKYESPPAIADRQALIGAYAYGYVAKSMVQKYPQLFDWLNLLDFNVMVILILMTVVAGFNMISGLLILLFRSISTIGILKSMGMTDRSIGAVFLKLSSNLVLKGMAWGNGIAFVLCIIQSLTHVVKLNPANYFVPFVPVALNVPMVLLADAVAYVVIMLLLLLPAMFISKVDPAQTVRAQ